jgi:DNA-binding winged helix-turn-helix (wHTH) protein
VRCCACLEGLRRRRKSVICKKEFSDEIWIGCCAVVMLHRLVMIIYCLLTRVELIRS